MVKEGLVEVALRNLSNHIEHNHRNPVMMVRHGMQAFCDWGNTFEEIDEAIEVACQRLVKEGQAIYNPSENLIEFAIYKMTKDGLSPAQTKISIMRRVSNLDGEGYVDAVITEAIRRLGTKNEEAL